MYQSDQANIKEEIKEYKEAWLTQALGQKWPLSWGETMGFLGSIKKPTLEDNMISIRLKWGQWERPKSCGDWVRHHFLASAESRMLTESTPQGGTDENHDCQGSGSSHKQM